MRDPHNVQKAMKAIVLTLAYSAQFGHGLTLDQIYSRLITTKPVSKIHFVSALRYLISTGLLVKKNKQFQLSDVLIRSFTSLAKKNEEIRSLVSFTSYIPWVRAVIITGSVAAGTTKPQDDIDFLIVTQSQRMWLVRPFVVLFGLLKGRRRSWSHEEPNSWCFNFWLEDSELAFQKSRRTMYTAFELCQANFVYDRDFTVELAFLRANTWVSYRLPYYFAKKMRLALHKKYQNKVGNLKNINMGQDLLTVLFDLLDSWFELFFSAFNYIFYFLQLVYMAPHRTTEQVSLRAAFFHPRDTKKILYAGWKSELELQLAKNEKV